MLVCVCLVKHGVCSLILWYTCKHFSVGLLNFLSHMTRKITYPVNTFLFLLMSHFQSCLSGFILKLRSVLLNAFALVRRLYTGLWTFIVSLLWMFRVLYTGVDKSVYIGVQCLPTLACMVLKHQSSQIQCMGVHISIASAFTVVLQGRS